MVSESSSAQDEVRTAEVVASLCLATDLGMGLPYEHGLHSTLLAMRLAERLQVDSETAFLTYYGCLLFYVGCTVDAEMSAELFDDGVLLRHFNPVMFGTPSQTVAGIVRALADSGGAPAIRAMRAVTRLPRAVRGHQRHVAALCEVAQMLSDRLGLPPTVRDLFAQFTDRWDGRGAPIGRSGEAVPLPLRIIHVARDTALQRMLGGQAHAARVIRERSGGAFDPAIATLIVDDADDLLSPGAQEASAWDAVLAAEPDARLTLRGGAIDRALAAMGDFADLASKYFVGHATGVADLTGDAARRCGFPADDVVALRRAALVHDVGRCAVPVRIWQKPAPLTMDEWEQIRLHAYHSERVLGRAPFLSALGRIATAHHERLDGAGYHRGATGAMLTPAARLLAAADAYHAMTEPRPHRDALEPERAAALLERDARDARLDADSVAAVLEAAGHRRPQLPRPAGLTARESEVVGLLARGLQTKQIARALGISAKTADRHIQNAYAKIGVSTRAAATLFAMQHGLAVWGELPIGGLDIRS